MLLYRFLQFLRRHVGTALFKSMGHSFVQGRIWNHPSKMIRTRPKLVGGVIWARGKQRGFSPEAAARHSQYARVYTEFVQRNTFFGFSRVQPSQSSKMSVRPAKLKNGQKTPKF